MYSEAAVLTVFYGQVEPLPIGQSGMGSIAHNGDISLAPPLLLKHNNRRDVVLSVIFGGPKHRSTGISNIGWSTAHIACHDDRCRICHPKAP